MIAMEVFKLSGHEAGAPNEVVVQSYDRISDPISPPPDMNDSVYVVLVSIFISK